MNKSIDRRLALATASLACAFCVWITTAEGRGGGRSGNTTPPHVSDADLKLPPGVSRAADGSLPWAYTSPGASPDREAMLIKLGIERTRRGLDAGESYPPPPHNANYTEELVDDWPVGYKEVITKPRPPHASTALPELLVCKDGTKVTDAKTWWEKRRPEIVEDFEREIYGRIPKNAPKVTWEVTSNTVNGNTRTKQIRGHIDNSAYPSVTVQDITITLNTPANATGPVPLIMTFGGGGGFGGGGPGGPGGGRGGRAGPGGLGAPPATAPATAPGARLDFNSFFNLADNDLSGSDSFAINPSDEPLFDIGFGGGGGGAVEPGGPGGPGAGGAGGGRGGRGGPGGGGGPGSFLQKGWGTAALGTGYQPSNWSSGVLALCREGKERQPDEWGVLRAWGWGVSRAIDYFETDKDVDAKAVALEGHSFQGKAAIVSAVFEPRVFTAFVSSSGMGGAKIWRRNYGEPLEGICGTGEYYEICGNLLKYAGPLTPDDLPVDAHEFIALMAPRPIFISGGVTWQNKNGQTGDGWQDSRGMFLACEGASPAYELLGKKGLTGADGTRVHEFPPVETPLINGECAYREHNSGHTDGPNWPTFVEFCSHYFKVNSPAGPAATP